MGGTGDPVYVVATDPRANTVTVGPLQDLDTTTVPVRGLRLHRPAAEVDAVKLRYRYAPVACTLDGEEIRLTDTATAPAPGQTACLLAGDVVVGSATIVR